MQRHVNDVAVDAPAQLRVQQGLQSWQYRLEPQLQVLQRDSRVVVVECELLPPYFNCTVT